MQLRRRCAGLAAVVTLLAATAPRAAAKAKGAGGFEGVECPEGFELQDNGACIMPLDDEPTEPPVDLLEAAERGDVEAVTAFIEDGADVDQVNSKDQTPLHLAARYGNDEIVKLLVNNGAQVDPVDAEGQQPHHIAIPHGFFDTFTLLVELGADPNARIGAGTSLLHFGAYSGTAEAIEFMIAAGCDPNAEDKDGARPLHAAAFAGKKDIVEALAKHDADVNAGDVTGTTPLHLTAQQGHVYVCRALLKLGADPTQEDNNGATALSVATHTNSGAVLAEMLQTLKGRKAKKALRKRIGPNEETLLHYAARTGNLDVTKTILAHPKTEVDAVSKDGHTALILAAMSGNYKVCKAIIQAGADATIHSSIDLIAAADAGDVKNGDADPSGASDSRVNEDEDRGGGGGHANTHWEKRDSEGTIQDVGYVPPRKLWKKLKKLLPSDFQQRWWNEKLEKDPDLKAEAGRVALDELMKDAELSDGAKRTVRTTLAAVSHSKGEETPSAATLKQCVGASGRWQDCADTAVKSGLLRCSADDSAKPAEAGGEKGPCTEEGMKSQVALKLGDRKRLEAMLSSDKEDL